MHDKDEKRTLRFEWRNIKQRDHVENLRLQGSIILKEILNGNNDANCIHVG